MVDVNLLNTSGLFYLEIIIHPYIVPISLRGRYYYRSGSTKQELIGTALTDFLLRKTGKSWDEVIEPTASLQDIDEVSLAIFISASLKAGRISDVDGLSTGALLSKLRLIDDKGNIKRAAIVLFGKSVSKFYNNCIVKIGRFKSNEEELIFQELEEGNIIQLLKDIPSQLNRKFLIKPISFEGLQRIEKGEYPVAAIREMLLNALVHRSYLGTVVQIRVYDNSINIWNEGLLPEGLSLGSLKRQHPSRPRNQLIADVCFKGGYIDTWGRGTLKIINACLEAELPEPEILEQDGGILVKLFKNKYSAEQLKKMKLNGRQLGAVFYLIEKGSITNTEYQKINDISRQTATRDLKELVEKFKILRRDGITGAGTSYALIDS
jgi:ATP-dependent DNA helicase RecG